MELQSFTCIFPYDIKFSTALNMQLIIITNAHVHTQDRVDGKYYNELYLSYYAIFYLEMFL